MPEPNSGPGRSYVQGASRVARPGMGRGGPDDSPTRRPQKQQSSPMVQILVLFVSPAILGVAFLIYHLNQPVEVPREETKVEAPKDEFAEKYKAFEAKLPKARAMAQAARKHLRDESIPRDQSNKEADEAKRYISDLQAELDTLLAPLKDPSGALPAQYSGYERPNADLQTWLYDLQKESGF